VTNVVDKNGIGACFKSRKQQKEKGNCSGYVRVSVHLS